MPGTSPDKTILGYSAAAQDNRSTVPGHPCAVPGLTNEPPRGGATGFPMPSARGLIAAAALVALAVGGLLLWAGTTAPAPVSVPLPPARGAAAAPTPSGPRIAIIVTGLGLSDLATREALRDLPAAVTFSFLPYAGDVPRRLAAARERGHQTMLDLPLEMLDLAGAAPPGEGPSPNLERLRWIIDRGSGYLGLVMTDGDPAAAAPADRLRPLFAEVKAHGLDLVDAVAGDAAAPEQAAAAAGLVHAAADRLIDREASRAAISRQLDALEQVARRRGWAIGVGSAYPVTIRSLAAWAEQLSAKGLVLAPLSAVFAG
jgi:uncharacterized protein